MRRTEAEILERADRWADYADELHADGRTKDALIAWGHELELMWVLGGEIP